VLKGLKRAIGAAAAEEYYEHALLALDQGRRQDAVQAFEQAAKKAADEGKAELEQRARASAALYHFIDGGDLSRLKALRGHLERAGWVERPGDRSDRVPGDQLIAEIDGRLAAAEMNGSSPSELSDVHKAAADAFARCPDHRLVTYPHHHAGDGHVTTARSRQLFHTGRMYYHAAEALLDRDPEGAGKMFGRAIAAFAGCEDEAWQEDSASRLKRIQTRRTCWVCQREFPGEGDYYETVPAYVTPFVKADAAREGRDASSIDVDRRHVVLCRVCRSLIDIRLEAHVRTRLEEVRAWTQSLVERTTADILAQVTKR
jgi:hypothetical protein